MTDIVAQSFDRNDLIGAWEYVSAHTELPNGVVVYNFGPNPKGIFVILKNGHYSHIVMSDSIPPVASGQLKVTTPEENKAIAQNVLAHFGTWVANGEAGNFVVGIEWSSFANFNGISQQRIVTKLNETELEYVNLATTNGGDAKVFASLRRIAKADDADEQ